MREPSNPEIGMKRQAHHSPEDVTLHAVSAKVTFQGQQLQHLIQASVTHDSNIRLLHTAVKEGFEDVFRRIDSQKANTNLEAARIRSHTKIWSTLGTAGAFIAIRAIWERLVAAWHGFFGLAVVVGGYVAVASPVPG